MTKFVEACSANEFHERLYQAIEECQAAGLEVQVSHSMCQAQKGVGYMYSAVVVGTTRMTD